MHTVTFLLVQLTRQHRQGWYATQADRRGMLTLIGEQLHERYKDMRPQDLGGRHVQYLLTRWQAEGLSPATIKNRLAALRWWARKVGKASVIPRSNAQLGLPQRQTAATSSKAK